MMAPYETDVVVVGAGPTGLFSVFECGMHKLKCHVIDALPEIGGQCVALYPEKPIYDIPAYPQILAKDLIHQLKTQADPFAPVYHLGQELVEVVPNAQGFLLKTSKNVEIQTKALLIAAGVGAFRPHKPPLPDLELYEKEHVFYAVKDKERFRGQHVVIAGGGDSACDWALHLAPIAAKVFLVHRRETFRASPQTLAQLEDLETQGRLEKVVPYQLTSLEGRHGRLEGVGVQDLDGHQRLLKADSLLAFFGLSMSLGPIASWGLNLSKQHISIDPGTAETSVPGIYAIGDIATYPNKLKLILTGFAEAAQAAVAIRARLYPHHVFHFEYSTTQGVPKAF